MDSGSLDQKITLQRNTETSSQGNLVPAWTSFASVWAKVISQKGNEAFEAARLNARDVLRICIRYRTDVDVTHRVVWGGQNYNITNVDRSQRRQGELWLSAQAVGAS